MLSDLYNLLSFQSSGFPRLIEWARSRGISFGLERSVRIRNGQLETYRCLLSFVKDAFFETSAAVSMPGAGSAAAVGGYDPQLLFEVCRLLRCPENILASIARNHHAAAFVHFGFEATTIQTIAKCYLELPPVEQTASGPEVHHPGSRIQFLGYKWNMTNSDDAVLTLYRTWPASELQSGVGKFFAETPELFRPFASKLITMLGGNCEATSLMDYPLLEVRDEGGPRCAWDLNVYDGGLTIGQMAEPFLLIPELPSGQRSVDSWRESVSNSLVGHIATGHDRGGHPFLTIYYGGTDVG